jgi:phosphate starvation-inducible PhoH-like protein
MSRKRNKSKRFKRTSSSTVTHQEHITEYERHYGNEFKEVARTRNIKLVPKTTNQSDYIMMLTNPHNTIILAVGPAGTGKTMLACLAALKAYTEGKVKKIILTRPAVEVDENHGFLPGGIKDKMEPWTRPIFDVFEEYFSPKAIKYMVDRGLIEVCPLAYMRGRNFKDAFIILDESQNCTTSQMKMALTRIAHGSRMVVTGDVRQTDRRHDNGLIDFAHRLNKHNGDGRVQLIKFDKGDIQRHPVVTQVLNIYGDVD